MHERTYSIYSRFLVIAFVDDVHTYVYTGIFRFAQSVEITRTWFSLAALTETAQRISCSIPWIALELWREPLVKVSWQHYLSVMTLFQTLER